MFTITGNAGVTINGIANLNVNLGGGGTSGLVVSNGTFTSMDATVNGSFTVDQVTITATSLEFYYGPDTTSTAATPPTVFEMLGSASAAVTGLGTLMVSFGGSQLNTITLTFGDATNPTVLSLTRHRSPSAKPGSI